MFLGNENAEKDKLLLQCCVESMACPDDKQIITGKWGSGKTGCLLVANRDYNEKLKSISKKLNKIWFIDGEKDLDLPILTKKFNNIKFKNERIRYIQAIWKAEIIRKAVIQLAYLETTYPRAITKGIHWKFIQRIPKDNTFMRSLWKQIPDIFKLITPSNNTSIENLQGSISDLFTSSSYDALQACLYDLKNEAFKPIVAIEIIDSPNSEFESKNPSLAKEMVVALLNMFCSYFQIDEDQLLRVNIVVPWHRYDSSCLNNPQKIRQYEINLSWTKSELREFINKRLKIEFIETGRQLDDRKDAWQTLFNDKIKNPHSKIYEDTFDYILRHTHYYPRQVQRITRKILEMASKGSKISKHGFLAGLKDKKIRDKYILEVTNSPNLKISNDSLIEAERKYPELKNIYPSLMNIQVPISYKPFCKILDNSKISIEDQFTILWKSGIIGIELTDHKKHKGEFRSINLPVHLRKVIRKKVVENDKENEITRWFVFEHRYSTPVNEFINAYYKKEYVELKFILHPSMYGRFGANVTNKYPIG